MVQVASFLSLEGLEVTFVVGLEEMFLIVGRPLVIAAGHLPEGFQVSLLQAVPGVGPWAFAGHLPEGLQVSLLAGFASCGASVLGRRLCLQHGFQVSVTGAIRIRCG